MRLPSTGKNKNKSNDSRYIKSIPHGHESLQRASLYRAVWRIGNIDMRINDFSFSCWINVDVRLDFVLFTIHSLREAVWRSANVRREGTAREENNNSRFFSRQENLHSVSFNSVQPWYSRRWVGFRVDPSPKKIRRKKEKHIFILWHSQEWSKKKLDPVIRFRLLFFPQKTKE